LGTYTPADIALVDLSSSDAWTLAMLIVNFLPQGGIRRTWHRSRARNMPLTADQKLFTRLCGMMRTW
jgi:hypothetical protein